MINNLPDHIGTMAHFAESNGESKDRLKKRLSQDRRPTTQASSDSWVNWGGMAEVLGQPFDVSRIPLSKLEQMQRDPMLSFGLMFVKVPLIRAHWYIKSTDARRAAFVDNALRMIYGRLVLAYSNAFSFGFSAMVKRFEYFQPDWTFVEELNEDGIEQPVWPEKNVKALIWKPVLALNPRNAQPHWNSRGEFSGIDLTLPSSVFPFFTGRTSKNKAADVPLDWALWATNEKDSVYGSFWGYPRLGYAYRYWWSYWYLFSLSDRAFERWADPPVIVYHPSETGAVDEDGNDINYSTEGLNLAEKLRSGANVSLPGAAITSGIDDKAIGMREWQAEQMKSESNFGAMDSWFKYLDVQKLRSMMVPEQSLMEGQGGSSSRNVAEQFGDIFQESQAVVMQEIDDMINRYMIPQLLEANFGPGGPSCTKITTGFDPSDIETMRTIIGAIANKNGTIPDVDVRAMLKQVGVPLLSWADTKTNLEKIAEEQDLLNKQNYEKLAREAALKGHKPPSTSAKLGEAGVDEDGLYYNDRPTITLSDEEGSVLRRAFDKLLGRSNEDSKEEVGD